MRKAELGSLVESEVNRTPVLDMHTHLYDPQFGSLLLWGIDELLTYHYLLCEARLRAPMPSDKFWAMSKQAMAEYVWENLFVRSTPISEATRGVVTILKTLGFDPRKITLPRLRKHFAELRTRDYVDTVFKKANLEAVVMTNDILDAEEQAAWRRLKERDPRFLAAMRIDSLLADWKGSAAKLRQLGYDAKAKPDAATCKEVRRFLSNQAKMMRPVYMAASLPPTFEYPDQSDGGVVMEQCVLPFSRERGLPVALMIGVRRQINPGLRVAGDGLGRADVSSVERLCRLNPDSRFLVTMLSRENQHEFCVAARKFENLMVFGCWWFLNVPSIIAEMTAERVELLGTHCIPQHSDARILDQLIYKWTHSRKVIAQVLTSKYTDLIASGWTLRAEDVRRDVQELLSGNFRTFARLAR